MIERAHNARAVQMPTLTQLQYAQALLTVIGLALVSLWIVGRVIDDPSSIVSIARKKVG
jgi:hypothetical protein